MSVHLKRLHDCMLLVYCIYMWVCTCFSMVSHTYIQTSLCGFVYSVYVFVCVVQDCYESTFEFSVGVLPKPSFGILSAPVHLHPRCHTGVSRVWGHTGRGWGPQEETGSTEDQRRIWKLWNGPAVCCNVYSYSHTPFSTVHHCLCV